MWYKNKKTGNSWDITDEKILKRISKDLDYEPVAEEKEEELPFVPEEDENEDEFEEVEETPEEEPVKKAGGKNGTASGKTKK